jgi:CarD family transcriptional regulator
MPNKIKKTSPTPKAASKKPAAPAKKTVAKASIRKTVAKPAPKPAAKAAPAPAKAKAKAPVSAAKPPVAAAKPPIPAAKPSAAKPEPVKAVPMAAKPAAKPEPAKAVAKAAPAPKAVPAPKTSPAVAAAPVAAPVPVKKAPSRPLAFTTGDHVVYPTHGVGQITEIEEREVAGMKLTLYVVTFDKDKMTLRVPVAKVEASGMRKLSTPKIMETAMATLKGRARIKRTMWSRRAQEYEAKINSGDPISIAEVVRDLHRSASQPEQSYSERQIYEAALDRLVREIAAVENIDENAATERLHKVLKVA